MGYTSVTLPSWQLSSLPQSTHTLGAPPIHCPLDRTKGTLQSINEACGEEHASLTEVVDHQVIRVPVAQHIRVLHRKQPGPSTNRALSLRCAALLLEIRTKHRCSHRCWILDIGTQKHTNTLGI